MPALDTISTSRLALAEAKALKRTLQPVKPLEGTRIRRNGRELVSFASNDYLGLSRHPDIIHAAQDATGNYGAGAGASRLAVAVSECSGLQLQKKA